MNYLKFKNDVFEAVTDYCSYLLNKSEEACSTREYIDARLPKSTQNKFGIGYFPKPGKNLNELISVVGESNLEEFSIVYPKYESNGTVKVGHFSEHNLIMPFKNVHGDIISLLGRSILSEHEQKENKLQKYKYTINADKELYVFGLDDSKQSIIDKGYVICVEGQFDHITCQEYGITNTVALGWATLSRYQLFQISKYTENVVILFDNDEAGNKGRENAKKRFSHLFNIKTMKPPEPYKDMDEFLRKNNSEEGKKKAINLLNNLEINGR